MSKKATSEEGSTAVATITKDRDVVGAVTVRPVKIVDEGIDVAKVEGLPEEYQGGEVLSGFPPSAKFEKPGDCIFGEYVGMRENVGPNNSRLYEVAAFQGVDKEPLLVAVWGSTALDRLFDSAYPPINQGTRIAVIYVGEKMTKRAQNPVKLFALKVKR